MEEHKAIETKSTFEFTSGIKKWLMYMIGIGVLGLVAVFFLYPENMHSRLWSNLLLNTYYFTGIGLFGLFVVAAAQLAYGGWNVLIKRILISLSAFSRFGGFMLLAIVGLGAGLHVHNLYHEVTEALSQKVVAPNFGTKAVFFALPFWLSRIFIYSVLWLTFSIVFDKFFGRTDHSDPTVYKKSKLLAAAFIVVFALTESAISWDAVMSMDPHWYSTLFGWYNFASYGCAAWAMTILIVIFLKSQGYLNRINENHVHDLGKMLFGFSVFWTYLWFSQFMLQWYANIPEDTNFWVKRFDVTYFKVTIFLSLIINFVFPLIVIIRRGAKRNFKLIGFAAAMLIMGHYIDFFNYTFPESNWNKEAMKHEGEKHEAANAATTMTLHAENTGNPEAPVSDAAVAEVKHEAGAVAEGAAHEGAAHEGEHAEAEEPVVTFAGIGIFELMIFCGFLGVFLWLFFNNLSKRPLIIESDPYLQEAERLTVTYS